MDKSEILQRLILIKDMFNSLCWLMETNKPSEPFTTHINSLLDDTIYMLTYELNNLHTIA